MGSREHSFNWDIGRAGGERVGVTRYEGTHSKAM